MDACIARGGISHVLSQARASLKNPSRPFTPRSTGRSLFQGDDYRPGSRPSSSYSVVEQKGVDTKQYSMRDDRKQETPVGPKGSSLPPRPAGKAAKTRSAVPTPPASGSASGPQVKLMHAPVLQDQETTGESSDGELSGEENDEQPSTRHGRRVYDEEDLLESSLEIPSSDSLAQTLATIENQLNELSRQPPATIKRQALESFTSAITAFSTSSAVCMPRAAASSRRASPSNTAAAPETVRVWALRRRLFDCLVDLAVGTWQASARGVVSITPCALELYQLGFSAHSYVDEEADAKVVALGKVLFVLSKESGNDTEFCNVHYVESAIGLLASANACKVQSSKQSNSRVVSCPMKTLIYVAGTLKNISSGDEKMLKMLATNGAIAVLSGTLLWRSADAAENKEIAQLLVQTTTILRNLSTSKSYLKQFNEAQVACRLCETVSAFIHHQELMVNVSRTLGKLTLHEVPRSQINQRTERYVGNLVKLVDPRTNPTLVYASSAETSSSDNNQGETKSQDVLLVRIFFVLGNLCAGNDRNREFLGLESDAIPALLQSLQHYGRAYVRLLEDQQDGEDQGSKPAENVTDVLVKLVRLIANMAMNADVGSAFNAEGDQLAILLDVLECAQASGCHEELMLNIVSCITNLSYFCSSSNATSTSAFIESHHLQIAAQLAQILWDRNEEAVLEATRAFGNLSRFKDVLRVMGEQKVLDGFVILLDHSNREIVYTVCGVLMNAALDETSRAILSDVRQVHSGVGEALIDARTLLVGILECAALDDIEMSCIAAKVLYNLLLSKRDAASEAYMASEDGATLHRIVTAMLKALSTSDAGADDIPGTRAELQGVLTQLQRNVKRSDA